MRWFAVLGLLCATSPAGADTIVAARTIRAQEILAAGDLQILPGAGQGDVSLDDLIGKEVRVALYPGRPVRASDVGPPALIDRNQIVPLIYASGGLRIVTEGRALTRAAEGEHVRVMNLASRASLTGRVTSEGHVLVSR